MRISECVTCNNTNTRATEIYDHLDDDDFPLMCWQCGIAAEFERNRILALLNTQAYGAARLLITDGEPNND